MRSLYRNDKNWVLIAGLGLVVGFGMLSAPALGQDGDGDGDKPKAKAKFSYLRYDEDFSYLDGDPDSYVPDRGDFLKNISLFDDWRLDTGGEFRVRVESRSNAGFGARPRTQNTQQFYRYMVHFNVKYRDVFRAFVQGAVIDAEDQDGPFNPIAENHGELQQLFFDYRPFGEGSSLVIRVGRQELNYGVERLVSPFDWASTRRRFDAVKVFSHTDLWDLDAFYAKPVPVRREQRDRFNEEFDFWGVYTTYKGIPGHGLDLYFLGIDRTEDTLNPNGRVGDQSIFTLGSRFWGKTAGVDYETELSGQWGKWAGDTVQAWSWAFNTGYTFEDVGCKPRIGAGFDWASGDEDPYDGKVGTFNQMFPLGHAYFGFLDLIGRQNVTAVNVNMSAWAIPKKVKAKLTFHSFWLNADKDSLYNAGGAPTLRDSLGTSGEQLGHELDLTVNWKINNHSSMLFGYSHFWNDGFINNLIISSDDPDFVYLQYQYRF